MATDRSKVKNKNTVTLNDGKKITVSHQSDGVVHIMGDLKHVIPLSDLRPDKNDSTNWFYVGDMHRYSGTFCGQEIAYEALKPITRNDVELLRKWVSTGRKDENARKELERRGIRPL